MACARRYDDLSASVQMFYEGPPLPGPPPVRSACGCNAAPYAGESGALRCPDYQTLLFVERADGGASAVQCVTLPNYDVHMNTFAFSQCWR